MLVFWAEKLVFFAVPKTGTTSIEMALRPVAGVAITDPPIVKHTPVYRYRRFLKPYFEACGGPDFETIAIMREPVSWLGSWYRYRARPELDGQKNSTAGISFDAFVAAYLEPKRPSFAQVGSQAKFLDDGTGQPGVDRLFRYEDPGALHGFLEERLARKLEFKRLNASPPMELSLSRELQRRLRDEAALEFEFYAQAGL
ncbi:gamma-glutamyl kinase [Anianabacter salinae]|uniref:gamma-glutamyl kinase n=1 Tax=Anianabacter salinae TaxID=2851023 RepID=UPI00225E41FC|nr:gamma-glutamyl kinase [Anianabacter salinae]MBV0912098.1 gamma-glutamyl kinase [Anianabacter salinae]